MKWIKGLWALGLSILIVIIMGGLPSILIDDGYGYFATLQLPRFFPSHLFTMIVYGIMLLDMVALIVYMIVIGFHKKSFIILGIIGLLQIAGIIAAFVLHLLIISLAISSIIILLMLAFTYWESKVRKNYFIFFLPYFVWLCYVFGVNYSLVILN